MEHSSHNLLQAGSQTAISDRMRELLARAAQDHVYEQRTQGAVLDEIRQRLEGMEWLLREVRERELGGLGVALEAITQRLDDMAVRRPPGRRGWPSTWNCCATTWTRSAAGPRASPTG
ncbi:hypothetical protein [Microbispora sp. GKU 823]|uniref:hypothetical protein n=1 Tax=Microbispora sp. GKU 823 TaxID=1652100 RepID=UPI0009A297EA|nr:hypothetical protein [Microbispora sp. GKU 823]OPG10909.1 hypothetical protein B1L11_22320 [Microbispora sp. GKU 823]